MSKKTIYIALLIMGILSFFLIKDKFSHKHHGYKLRYSLYSEQTKSSKIPLHSSFFYTVTNEEDELSHPVKASILLFVLASFILISGLILIKLKLKFLAKNLFFGAPTYLAIRNFRI
ncbi:MAG: hypothetical protein HY062_03860 [Bacteroidetes bacterium]|nr:hypothetical protein [Bacteroidota bacterium]